MKIRSHLKFAKVIHLTAIISVLTIALTVIYLINIIHKVISITITHPLPNISISPSFVRSACFFPRLAFPRFQRQQEGSGRELAKGRKACTKRLINGSTLLPVSPMTTWHWISCVIPPRPNPFEQLNYTARDNSPTSSRPCSPRQPSIFFVSFFINSLPKKCNLEISSPFVRVYFLKLL